jgi:hypothetical protein
MRTNFSSPSRTVCDIFIEPEVIMLTQKQRLWDEPLLQIGDDAYLVDEQKECTYAGRYLGRDRRSRVAIIDERYEAYGKKPMHCTLPVIGVQKYGEIYVAIWNKQVIHVADISWGDDPSLAAYTHLANLCQKGDMDLPDHLCKYTVLPYEFTREFQIVVCELRNRNLTWAACFNLHWDWIMGRGRSKADAVEDLRNKAPILKVRKQVIVLPGAECDDMVEGDVLEYSSNAAVKPPVPVTNAPASHVGGRAKRDIAL